VVEWPISIIAGWLTGIQKMGTEEHDIIYATRVSDHNLPILGRKLNTGAGTRNASDNSPPTPTASRR